MSKPVVKPELIEAICQSVQCSIDDYIERKLDEATSEGMRIGKKCSVQDFIEILWPFLNASEKDGPDHKEQRGISSIILSQLKRQYPIAIDIVRDRNAND